MNTAPVPSETRSHAGGRADDVRLSRPSRAGRIAGRILSSPRSYPNAQPDDEMLRILEAMGILACSHAILRRILRTSANGCRSCLSPSATFRARPSRTCSGYVHELESRLAELPSEIEAGLDPKQIAKMLGESLRQHFLRSRCA